MQEAELGQFAQKKIDKIFGLDTASFTAKWWEDNIPNGEQSFSSRPSFNTDYASEDCVQEYEDTTSGKYQLSQMTISKYGTF